MVDQQLKQKYDYYYVLSDKWPTAHIKVTKEKLQLFKVKQLEFKTNRMVNIKYGDILYSQNIVLTLLGKFCLLMSKFTCTATLHY